MDPNERVLCIPTQHFRDCGYFQGFRNAPPAYWTQLLDRQNLSFRPRGEVETDPEFKQLIPYMLIIRDSEEMYSYTRGNAQGEARLHAKRSLGVGGHISELDDSLAAANPFEVGMLRELFEEVELVGSWKIGPLGLINDDENEVGRVHLGLAHVISIGKHDGGSVTARESSMADAGLFRIRDIADQLHRYETWSELCFKALFGAPTHDRPV